MQRKLEELGNPSYHSKDQGGEGVFLCHLWLNTCRVSADLALSDVFDLNPLGSRGFCGVKGPQRGGERRKKDIVVEILVVVVRYSKARRHHRWAPKRDGGGWQI